MKLFPSVRRPSNRDFVSPESKPTGSRGEPAKVRLLLAPRGEMGGGRLIFVV